MKEYKYYIEYDIELNKDYNYKRMHKYFNTLREIKKYMIEQNNKGKNLVYWLYKVNTNKPICYFDLKEKTAQQCNGDTENIFELIEQEFKKGM